MKYKCKKCGAEYAIEEKTKVCPYCGLDICDENNANKGAKNIQEHLRRIEIDYEETGDSADVKTAISEWNSYKSSPDFNHVWSTFIVRTTGLAVAKKDKELLPVLKNHARDFDSQRTESDLFLTLLKTHPKLGTINDWEELIQRTHGDQTKFGILCDSIIYCIIKLKSKSFAVEIFNLFFSKKDEWADAGRKYIRALLSSDEIASDVFPVSAFNGATSKFALNLKSYCRKYLDGDHSLALEQTKVWENYLTSLKLRKKRNIIITSIVAGAAAVITIAVLIFLSSINKSTIEFTVDKVIEVTYGESPKEFLDGYYVSYKKNSGKAITDTLEDKIVGYNPELIGEQTVHFEFKGKKVTSTLILKKLQLEAPKLTQHGSYVKWDAVPHAQYYSVFVNASVTETLRTESLSYDLSTNENSGELKIVVRAYTNDKKYEASYASEPLTVTKLESPTNIIYMGGKLSWNAVNGATSYELIVNGAPYTVTSPECTVAFNQGDNTVTINAKGANENVIHGVTTQTIFYGKLDSITSMSYQNGNVSWVADENAKSFAVYVNGQYWKDFSRNYFSCDTDGFTDAFGTGIKEIGIVCKTATMGIESSDMKSYNVCIGNRIVMGDNRLEWTSLGQGATYFVTVNGSEYTLADNYLTLGESSWSVGNNTISINARLGGVEYICETATVTKHPAPSISVTDSGWSTDNNENNMYKVNDGPWSNTLPDVSTLLAGEHTVISKRVVSSSTALELESDESTFKIVRASSPTVYISGGMLQCTYDSDKYTLKVFYAPLDSDSWIQISSTNDIVNPGEYKLRASLTPNASAFEGFGGFLSSSYSSEATATKPAYPSVFYDSSSHTLTSDPVGAQFYYVDENGEEHEIIGGDASTLPGGAFSVYARFNATEDGVLNSANTPEHKRVSVFNLDIDFSVNALANQNTCYLNFKGCADISELNFTCKIEYFNANGELIGTWDRSDTDVKATNKTSDGDTIWTSLTYYHAQFVSCSFNDIKTFKVTVVIDFGTETLTREATTHK